ncbi:hypothetical protein L3Q82_025382, partial [Scortum barcoo]
DKEAHVLHVCQVLQCLLENRTQVALTRTVAHNQHIAICQRTPAPEFDVEQKVWLSSHDLPLQVESHKLAPRYICPYETKRIINPNVVRLKLPPALNVHLAFHMSLLKPVSSSPLSPPTEPTPPAWIFDNHPAFSIWHLLDV